MPEPENVTILVDTDIRLPSGAMPRSVLDALRRHLRQLEAQDGPVTERDALLNLLSTRQGVHTLPQALLFKVTETCLRHNVQYAVEDRRAMVSCPAIRSQVELDAPQREALRQLLLRDSGVLVASDFQTRLALTAELLGRRQQRALLAASSPEQVKIWVAALQHALGPAAPFVQPLRQATAESRVVVGHYEALVRLPRAALGSEYGMVVFEGLAEVDALTLMKAVRAAGARYLLGLAAAAERDDGLQDILFTALGGLTARLNGGDSRALRLSCRYRTTDFRYPYEGRHQYQAMLAALGSDGARARLVAEDVIQQAQAGHACLVLSERREHLELLASLLPAAISAAILTSAVRLGERKRLLTSFERGEVQVLLATVQIAAETVQSASIARLFITFPFSYARKLAGAVDCLLQPAPHKKDAALYDYDDCQVAPLHRAFEKRRQFLDRRSRQAEREVLNRAQLALPLREEGKQNT